MDITAAFALKPIERPAAHSRAPQDNPQADDFAAELDNASASPDKPEEAGKPEGPAKKTAKPAPDPAGRTVETDTLTQSGAVAVPAPPQPESIAPVQTGTPAAMMSGAPAPANTDLQTALQALIDATKAAPQSVAAAANGQAQAPSNATIAAPEPLGAHSAIPVEPAAGGAAQPLQSQPPPQTIAALSEGLKLAKPATPEAKKTGEAKIEAATAQSPAPAAVSPQTQAAAQPVQSGSKDGAPQNGDGPRQDSNVQAASNAAATAPAPQSAEFKIDANAASALQPAAQQAQNASPTAPALVAQNAPVFIPPEALGVAIARKALEGVNKFEMRLDPPELGRLDVTLEVDEAGNTRAHIRVERPEALELLQREAKGMEQALRQAGLTLDQSSLTFSLNGREGREAQEGHHHGRRAKFNAVLPEDEINAAAIRGTAPSANGLDLRV